MGAHVDDARRERLADLYRRYVPDMVRLAYLMTGDSTVAEDLAQEAFVRVTGRFAQLRSPDSFEAYLRRALVNLCKNHFRRRDTERAFLQLQVPPPAVDPHPASDEFQAIRTALLHLPGRQRAAIVLRYFNDLTERETADLLGCRPGTVKSLVSRALTSLREALGVGADSQ
jgi:RNA polymerase sigma-70 factor (sigma-E family)